VAGIMHFQTYEEYINYCLTYDIGEMLENATDTESTRDVLHSTHILSTTCIISHCHFIFSSVFGNGRCWIFNRKRKQTQYSL